MLSRVYIGIDLGSTSLKIAAFSGRDGQVLALAGAQTKVFVRYQVVR